MQPHKKARNATSQESTCIGYIVVYHTGCSILWIEDLIYNIFPPPNHETREAYWPWSTEQKQTKTFRRSCMISKVNALTVNRTQDLQIFSLTLSQLSYQSWSGTTCHNYQVTLDRYLQVSHNNVYNMTNKKWWCLFLQSRFFVFSAKPTNIYGPCHLSNLLPHRALMYSWWADPHGEMLSNIPSTMEKYQMATLMKHPALCTNQNMMVSCFLAQKWSWWSLPNSASWTSCSCVYPLGDENI